MHAWSWCGGMKDELFIEGQIHVNTSWHVKTSLALNEWI